MNLSIDWKNPVFDNATVLKIQPRDLDTFYCSATDLDKGNLFFVMLTSMHHYESLADSYRTAHLCYLMAYYLFITITPPGSWELAMHYIQKAISLHPCDEYREWFTLIQKGN